MKLRVCSVPGCPAWVKARGRCDQHLAQLRAQRGTTTQQGYGWRHQQRRARLVREAIGTRCPDCGALMTNPSLMVADHSTPLSADRASVADRVHCRPCSDKQGGLIR